uniref:UPF0481 protein At3g47200 family n=2 Tax=Cajanus cajan TaxID=3821 RepID=A0A151T901_CAJCA|nr:UPF0481 protein At3g47200 family [Cajanus cajan]
MLLLGAIYNNECQPHIIPIVPEELGKWSEKEYEPKVVSIGPRFKGRKELLPMEDIKLRCLVHLFKRTGSISHQWKAILNCCMRRILTLDATVRTSYGEQIDLDSYGLATIMLHYACFLLELFISQSVEWNSKLQPNNDTLPPSPAAQLGNMELILSDLTLLENQIPFFLLFNVFGMFFSHLVPDDPFRGKIYVSITQDLALSLFGYSRDSSSTSIPDPIDASHILQLVHSFILNPQSHHGSCVIDIEVNVNKQIEPKFCATSLLAAGVTIVKTEENSMIPKFSRSNGVLEVPPLHITQTMEAKWRNFIAWELHTTRWKKSVGRDLFTVRALLYNDLICCASDVQLLKNKGIIVDELGMSNHHLMDLLRSITNGVDRGVVHSTYWNMIHALNTYYATNCFIGFPIIVWHYLSRFSEWLYGLNKFLRRGYNFAAALITLLTVIQTCYTILSYHYPKNN